MLRAPGRHTSGTAEAAGTARRRDPARPRRPTAAPRHRCSLRAAAAQGPAPGAVTEMEPPAASPSPDGVAGLTPKHYVVRLLTERGVDATPEQLLQLKLPALIRRALAADVDGDLLGDALRGVQTATPAPAASDADTMEPTQTGCLLTVCMHCRTPMLDALLEDHREVCHEWPVSCINRQWGCDAFMPRWRRGQHLEHCPASVVVCGGLPGVSTMNDSELPAGWFPGAHDPTRSPADSHCRWLGRGQSICGVVVRRDQWEQHVQLHHVLLPTERTEYKVEATSHPGDPRWYQIDWDTLWQYVATLGWRELNQMSWWGAKDRIFLKPGVPFDSTGERLYTYLPTDYARDEFELRRHVATQAEEEQLAWLYASIGTRGQATVWLAQGDSGSTDSEQHVVGPANRCHYCCAVGTPRLEIDALPVSRRDNCKPAASADASAAADRLGLRLLGTGSDVIRLALAPFSTIAGTCATGKSNGVGIDGPAGEFMNLAADIHQQVMRWLAPGDITRLAQCSRYWRTICSDLCNRTGAEIMCLGGWEREEPVIDEGSLQVESELQAPMEWLRVLRHVSLLSAVANGGSMDEVMVEVTTRDITSSNFIYPRSCAR